MNKPLWRISVQAILESPLSYEAWEDFGLRTVFRDWFELGEKKDDYALALAAKFNHSLLLSGYYQPTSFSLAGVARRIEGHTERMYEYVANFIEDVVDELKDYAGKKSIPETEDFRKLGEAIKEAERSGTPTLLRVRGILWYVTWIGFHPRYIGAEVFGPLPIKVPTSLNGFTEDRRLGVAIPFAWKIANYEKLPITQRIPEIPVDAAAQPVSGAYDGRVPLLNFFNAPLFYTPGGGSVDLLKTPFGSIVHQYPMLYYDMGPDVAATALVFGYDCPMMLKWKVVYEHAQNVRPLMDYQDKELERAAFRPLEVAVRVCQNSKPVFGALHLSAIHGYVLHPAITGALYDVFEWARAKGIYADLYEKVEAIAKAGSNAKDKRGFSSLIWGLVPKFYTLFPLKGTTRAAAKNAPETWWYGFLALYPSIGDGKAYPAIITFSKWNIHPGSHYWGYQLDGQFIPVHKFDERELVLVAKYLFAEDEDFVCEGGRRTTATLEVEGRTVEVPWCDGGTLRASTEEPVAGRKVPTLADVGFDARKLGKYAKKLYHHLHVKYWEVVTKSWELVNNNTEFTSFYAAIYNTLPSEEEVKAYLEGRQPELWKLDEDVLGTLE